MYRRLIIAILSIMATAGTHGPMLPLVFWFVDKVRYEGVINGYLPLSGYIDDGMIRTQILETKTIQGSQIKFSDIRSYRKDKDNKTLNNLYDILNKSYKICFGPKMTLNKGTNYIMTHIDGYGPLHFCSIGKPPTEYSDFNGPCIYNVCKVTSAVKIRGGCKILIQVVLNTLFFRPDIKTADRVCLLVRINTDIKFPYTINYPAIRCYLQSGFRFVGLNGLNKIIINNDFKCNENFEDFKNALRSYILNYSSFLLKITHTDGDNALMVCVKPAKPFTINVNVNPEVVKPSSASKHTFTSGDVEIPYYNDVYGINPEAFNEIDFTPSIIDIMKTKMGQGPPLECSMPTFSYEWGIDDKILIQNYNAYIPLIIQHGNAQFIKDNALSPSKSTNAILVISFSSSIPKFFPGSIANPVF